MDEEKTLWAGSPSQLVNLPAYVLCAVGVGVCLGAALVLRGRATDAVVYGLAGAALIPVVIAAAKWVLLKTRHYELTTERLRVRTGLLSRRTDEVELYRVKDYVLVEPFWLRLFGLGDLVVNTTDDINPNVVLAAVPQAAQVRDELRKHVELCRDRKRVRVAEME